MYTQDINIKFDKIQRKNQTEDQYKMNKYKHYLYKIPSETKLVKFTLFMKGSKVAELLKCSFLAGRLFQG